MTDALRDLADLLLEAEVLTFGDFVTKSGRSTPYFLNFGRIRTGQQVARLAELYAARIDEVFGTEVDLLFGPAYKGIPLAVATAQATSASASTARRPRTTARADCWWDSCRATATGS